jgi:anti-sigma B factor antagonist
VPEPAHSAVFSLEIERCADSAVVVRCHGRLIAGVTDILDSQVHPLIPGSKRVILDLTDLATMDSMGLGTIIGLYVSAKSAGCSFEMINIGKRILQLLGFTNLLNVFTVVGEHNIRM